MITILHLQSKKTYFFEESRGLVCLLREQTKAKANSCQLTVSMPWWTCFNCANIRTSHNNCNDIFVLDFAHHSLHDVPADVFQYERTLEELYLSSNRVSVDS